MKVLINHPRAVRYREDSDSSDDKSISSLTYMHVNEYIVISTMIRVTKKVPSVPVMWSSQAGESSIKQ